MLKGRAINQGLINIPSSTGDVDQILKMAKQAHENYILRSCETDLENAIDYYIKVMKMDPSISESYYKLASLLWEKGVIDINAALAQCQNAINMDPKSSTARLYMGYFLKTAGAFDEAEREFDKAVELNRFFSSRPRLALSMLLFQKMGCIKPSFRDFTKAVYNLFSGTVMVLWDYSTLRVLYRSVLEDIKVLTYEIIGSILKTANKYDLALKTYESAAESTAKSSMFYAKVGDISLKRGRPEEAVRCYRKALKSAPSDSELWAKLATTLQTYYEDDVDEITDCYNILAELDPNNPRIYYELGHLYLKLDDKFSAVNAFKKALELDEDNPFYHNSLAYALIQLEDYNGAIEEYQKAIKINPDNEWTSVVCQALGSIYHQAKANFDAAIVAYQTAIVLDPYNVDAYLSLGEVYQDNNEIDKAIDSYCEAIKLNPGIAKAYSNLGLALWEKDYVQEAVVAYQKAIELDPEYEIAYNNLGVVYLDGVGAVDEAMEMFDLAIKYNPNYTLAYYNKGRCCQILGNKTEAASLYQMAIDLNKIKVEIDATEIEERLHNLFRVD